LWADYVVINWAIKGYKCAIECKYVSGGNINIALTVEFYLAARVVNNSLKILFAQREKNEK